MREAFAAEWSKLWSTRLPYGCLISVAVVTLALAAAVGVGAAGSDQPPSRNNLLVGLLGYGLVIVMAMAGLSVSSEYGSGTIRVTFSVLPRRGTVVVVKAALLAAVSSVVAAALTPAGLAVGYAAAGRPAVWDATTVRLMWGVPLIVGITAVIAVAVGVLLRRTAAVLSAVILWPLLIEGLTTLVPRIGQRVATVMPFANAHLFLGDPQGLPFVWRPAVGLLLFGGVATVLMGLAVQAARRRDV